MTGTSPDLFGLDTLVQAGVLESAELTGPGKWTITVPGGWVGHLEGSRELFTWLDATDVMLAALIRQAQGAGDLESWVHSLVLARRPELRQVD